MPDRLSVVINAVPLLSPLTGLGQYVRNLSEALVDLHQADLCFFYGFGWNQQIWSEGLPAPANRIKLTVRKHLPYSYELSRWLQQMKFSQGLGKYKPQLYHEPSFLSYDFDGPTVLSVHDLSWIRFPEAHPVERVRAMNKLFEPSLARADRIITDTEFGKQELIEVFGVESSKIHPIHLAAESMFKPLSSAETNDVLASKGLAHRNYWLAVGTIEPRKNLQLVLDAFSALAPATRKNTPLVIVGMVGWNVGDLLPKLQVMEQSGELVQLGYLTRSDLAVVVAGAKALVFPSVYEGFGLPLVEAMQCGVPVLASNTSCLPEVVGSAGLLFDSSDVDELKSLMLLVLENTELIDSLSARGLYRAKDFGWHKTAQQTMDVYRLALG
jgi:alpha-1,3-rhamnosyl/mannosyltransferase